MTKVHYTEDVTLSPYPHCKVDKRFTQMERTNDLSKVTCRGCLRRMAWELNDTTLIEQAWNSK